MPSDPWADFEEVSAPAGRDPWAAFEPVQAAQPRPEAAENFGLDRASGISATPWWEQGMFGGYGPSVVDMVDTLPAVGGAVGGAIAAASGLQTGGLGFAALPGAAALGGEAGEAWRQNIRRGIGAYAPTSSGEAATEIGRQGGIQAAAELGGQVVGKGLHTLAAPFPGSVDRAVASAAQRQGVEMPAAALSTSRVVPIAEAVAAKGYGGAQAADRYVRANSSLTAMADHTVARASKLTDDSARGKAIADGLDSFRKNWIKEKTHLYSQAALPEKGIKVQAQETVALLESIIKDKASAATVLKSGPSADAAFYEGLRNGLTKMVKGPNGQPMRVLRDVEAKDLLNAHKELSGKIQASFSDPFSAANKGALKKVSATMQGEMDRAIAAADPALAARLKVANEAYAEGLTKINSTFGKDIHRLAKSGQYDKIARRIANPRTSVDDIPKIMEVAGQEGTEAMQAAVIADLVSKAKNAQGQLTSQGLGRAMKGYGDDRLAALLPPEPLAKLRDLATLTNSLDKGQRVMNGSQTAYILSNMNAPAVLYHVMGSPIRRFLSSPVGQRWMTRGFEPFTERQLTGSAAGIAHTGTLPLTAEDPTGAR